jgi:hypothetical protein
VEYREGGFTCGRVYLEELGEIEETEDLEEFCPKEERVSDPW